MGGKSQLTALLTLFFFFLFSKKGLAAVPAMTSLLILLGVRHSLDSFPSIFMISSMKMGWGYSYCTFYSTGTRSADSLSFK